MSSPSPSAPPTATLWHPFDLFPDDLAVAPAHREAAPPPHARLIYGERVVRWFKEAPGQTYKKPVLDPGPGYTITVSPPAGTTREIGVAIERRHASPLRIEGTLTVRNDGLRSPVAWKFRQDFIDNAVSDLLPTIEEEGLREAGRIVVSSTVRGTTRRREFAAPRLLNPSAWLADFPRHLATFPWAGDIVVQEDFTLYSRGASLSAPGAHLLAHPLAAGLRGYVLRFGGGLPYEFWVNTHGLVVYLCAGPTRVYVLDQLEPLA